MNEQWRDSAEVARMSRLLKILLSFILLTPFLMAQCAHAGTLWIGGGIPLCTALSWQTTPRIIPNGFGGFVVVWQDDREMGSVFLQSVSIAGLPGWQRDGVSPCSLPGEEWHPAMIPDSEGGAIVAWIDTRSFEECDIYAQRLSGDGSFDWQPNGVPICAAPGTQSYPSICADGEEGAIITWWDNRAGSYGLHAQRVDAGGEPLWQAGGVVVCGVAGFNPAFMHPVTAAVSDGDGGVVIVWEDYRACDFAGAIYAQRLDSFGGAVWQENGIPLCDAPPGQWSPSAISDGDGGAIVVWHDFRDGADSQIHAQRVGAGGDLIWGGTGVPVCVEEDGRFDPVLAPDGEGGAYFAWIDLRSGTSHDIYAQRVSSGGDIEWGAGGVPLCAEPLRQADPALVFDGVGGAIAAWHDYRSSDGTDIRANKVSGAGALQWQPEGIPVCVSPGSQRRVTAAADGEGGAIFAWEDARSGSWDIYAQRVRANGEPVAALLQSCEAEVVESGIALRWTLSETLPESSFEISRSEAQKRNRFVRLAGAVEREGTSYSFRDGSAEAGVTYFYRGTAVADGSVTLLFETGPVRVPPAKFAILQNYPNPFSAGTVIPYDLPASMTVDLSVFSCDGALVARLCGGRQTGGRHTAVWNGTRENGSPAAPGVYYCTLKGDGMRVTKKIVLVR
jgi:hypothetical protein